MKKHILILALFFAIANCNAQKSLFNSFFAETNTLVGTAGQSNDVGIAALSGLQAGLSGSKVNQKAFNGTAFVNLEAGISNLSQGGGNDATFGVEMRLMDLLEKYYGGTQYFSKYAVGGTSLAGDWPPSYSSPTSLYNASTTQELAAKVACGLPFKAYVWIQGEADAGSSNANNYQTNLTGFINAKRTALGQPNMPFIIVSLSDLQNSTNYPFLSVVKAAQQAVAAAMTNVYYIEQNNVTSDGSHYTAAGYDSIAYQIFNVVKSLP